MKIKLKFFMIPFVMVVFFAIGNAFSVAEVKNLTAKSVDEKTCYSCHGTVEMLHTRGAHEEVSCVSCHEIPVDHLTEPTIDTRPSTRVDWDACGQCHEAQLESFMQLDTHRPARNEKSNEGGRAPNPAWDKLMAPHGFTKEHAATRSHSVMLVDQFVVDRAFGGRFQPINGWNYIFETGKVWDILEDTHPEEPNQKKFMRQTATANNPVCMSCKTFDHILDWQYMGAAGTDPDPARNPKWSRKSNSVEMAQAMNYALNCFTCHDPHSAEPRVVRDALIDAMTNPDWSDNLIQQDKDKPEIEVLTMGLRGFDRKIAIFKDPTDPKVSLLQCAQCHVEYNCNPGKDAATGGKIGFDGAITNHFPMKDSLKLYDHYFSKVNFQDFGNRFSGAPLWKGQHPESESYYMSKHSLAGVKCSSCHFGETVKKGGKKFTSHFAQTPRVKLDQTCLTSNCHGKGADKKWDKTKYSADYIKVSTNWSKQEAVYAIDSIKSYTKGRMRKAEFWLTELTDAIRDAQMMGVNKKNIIAAQKAQSEAHILWEYWTAENSDGFHNPALARESLTKSIDISMKGYGDLEKVLYKKGK